MKEVYLDNAASTKPYDVVIEKMTEFMYSNYANPSALHHIGHKQEKVIKKSRQALADVLNCLPEQIVFTSGGTESINTAVFSAHQKSRGKKLITTKIEHPATIESFKEVERRGGRVEYLHVDKQGKINMDELESALDGAGFISIMHVNNETGHILPVEDIAKLAHEKGALVHLDAVQSFCKMPLDIRAFDFASISSHKIHGPKGVGALYVKEPRKLLPLIHGGGQEANLRSGTENLPAIFGFSMATEQGIKDIDNKGEKMGELASSFAKKVQSSINNAESNAIGDTSPYILNISFMGIPGEVLVHELEKDYIYVSTGAACSSKKKGSHVLKEMGIKSKNISSAIRFSFSDQTNSAELNYTLEKLQLAVQRLSRIIK